MSTVLDERSLPRSPARRAAWMALALGLALLYIPTYAGLAQGLWRDDEYAHGPLLLAAAFWLAWRAWGQSPFAPEKGTDRDVVLGGTSLALGLALYVVGRSQSLPLFEMASHAPVLAGLVLLMGGTPALRRLAFAFLILLFAIPLPGFVLESVATPLKTLVSALVEAILQGAGYAVVRDGVVLEVGGYPMLVADACSGLNSLYSLFALGLVYLHLTGPSSRARWALVLASVVPIAIAANVVRVLILVLVTVHFGEEAGQGAVHEAAGIAVFVSALALLLGFDALVRRLLHARAVPAAHGRGPGAPAGNLAPRSTRAWPAYAAAIALVSAAVAAPAMKPVRAEGAAIDLERIVPAAFGDWRIDPEIMPVAPSPDVQAKLDRIYTQVTSRTYVSSTGERMMLIIAHGGDQSDALKAHRQEVCYSAQGFRIDSLGHGTLEAAGRAIPVTRMLAVRGERSEPVTYWFTMGDRVVLGRLERLRVQLSSGLAGRIPDGMLVRISSISDDAGRAYSAQQAFAGELFAAMPPRDATHFVGAAGS